MAHHPVYKNYIRRSLVIPASSPASGDELSARHTRDAPLQLSIHDYRVRAPATAKLTVLLTHGTSFNKYFWELVIDYILSQPRASGLFKRFIALDAANHGDSALLNQSSLPSTGTPQSARSISKYIILKAESTTACWPDDSRDILQTLKVLEVGDPVVGIGHSFGGGAL